MKGKAILLICGLVAILCPAAFGKIIYVDDDATGANDGSNWQNAYIYLQDALADANSVEKPVEIRIAQGIYKPDQGAGITSGDREATFQLINGVTLSGGYAGLTEPNPNERDYEKYETILSGDLANDDISWDQLLEIRPSDFRGWFDEPNREDNTYNVTIGCNIDETAILDGFSIENGCYLPGFDSCDGGLFVDSGSPTVLNCNFKRNSASSYGGAISCINNSNPTLINCTITRNWALFIGAMYNYNSNPSLINCIFSENFTEIPKGVIVERGYFPCGGMYNYNSDPTFVNCSFINNSSGGMRNYESNPILINCTVFGNSADSYGGILNVSGNPILTNCIVWGNIPGQINDGIVASYSNIQGGWEGEGKYRCKSIVCKSRLLGRSKRSKYNC